MVWHLPWLYDTALENPNTLLHLEHAHVLPHRLAMWWSVFQDEPHRLGSGARAGYVFAAFVLGSPVGLVMALVPNAIYDFYVEAHHRVWGLDPLEDQQLAGMLMAVRAGRRVLRRVRLLVLPVPLRGGAARGRRPSSGACVGSAARAVSPSTGSCIRPSQDGACRRARYPTLRLPSTTRARSSVDRAADF